jgi:D-alanine-D-alanine ligase
MKELKLPVKKVKIDKKALGPIPDLEKHVRPDWWRNIFNSLYIKTDADVVEDQTITKGEVDLIESILQPSKDARILDLCCGQGRHVLEFALRGYSNVEGFDRSHYLISKAKTRSRRSNLNIRFKEGDARKVPYLTDTFDFVTILGNSFGYFETTEDDLRVLQSVSKVLKPDGGLLIDVADGNYLKEKFQPRSWEWIDSKHFVCRERSLSTDGKRIISREVITHTEKGVLADQFYAERLYTPEDLKELLLKAGFSDPVIHAQIATDSQRNQDLGMMEKRIIITASIKKEATPQKVRKEIGVRKVAVVMGDPGKNDIIKPNAVFDEDDYDTINQLKNALSKIPGYAFSFVNNHETLIRDLSALKGKVDFILNLCDEGFNNKATYELHVPALLEMLDIRYTGGGPQCLAYCYDKSLVRGIANEMGIPVPHAFFIKPQDNIYDLSISFPVIVKPNFGDSSFGITMDSVCYNLDSLFKAITNIREKFGYDNPILVEEFLPGKDISVGIIGNPPTSYRVLPIIEEDYSALPEGLPKICGYEAKWRPDSPYWNIKSVSANLDYDTEKFLEDCCMKLFERLECRDYARFDWRLDAQGKPRLLEVNPNPGWCWDGHLNKMARLDEMSYTQMLANILKAAEQRLGIC